MFPPPIHLELQGQWWSISSTHTPQSLQCSTPVHLRIWHSLQKNFLSQGFYVYFARWASSGSRNSIVFSVAMPGFDVSNQQKLTIWLVNNTQLSIWKKGCCISMKYLT